MSNSINCPPRPFHHHFNLHERRENQQDRIQDGRQDGTISRSENQALHYMRQEYREDLREARSDGHVSLRERADLNSDLNGISRSIFAFKHNEQ